MRDGRPKNHVEGGRSSPKRLRVIIFRMAVAVALFSLLVGNIPRPAEAVTLNSDLVWFMGFNPGYAKLFNDTSIQDQPSNVMLATSKQIVQAGHYSAYYAYIGSPPGVDLRGYPTEDVSPSLKTFYVLLWVYVPSKVSGKQVKITPDWISFASLWLNDGGSSTGADPICINSDSSRTLHMNVHMINEILYSASSIQWPFNTWFSIGIYGQLNPGTANSQLIIYLNGQQIISFVGNLGPASDGLSQMHFGLYAAATQGTFAVYNDNIQLYIPS